MQNDSQRRIFVLLRFLIEQTDENHYVSGADILHIWTSHGIHANRKNVYSDIQLLMDFGLDIVCIKSTQNRYFIGSRLPEFKLLVDAVESSHLITEKKSAVLIEKLGRFTSRHNAALLNRPVYMDGTAKPNNEAVYYAIDAIQTAIHEQRAISFQYFEYIPKKRFSNTKAIAMGSAPMSSFGTGISITPWTGPQSMANWRSSGWTA